LNLSDKSDKINRVSALWGKPLAGYITFIWGFRGLQMKKVLLGIMGAVLSALVIFVGAGITKSNQSKHSFADNGYMLTQDENGEVIQVPFLANASYRTGVNGSVLRKD